VTHSDVGIVIVTFNSAGHIGACLDAALATEASIVVVDNASADGTCEEVQRRGVRLLANPVNRGFAAAVNQGIRSLTEAYLLVLNPDAAIEFGLDRLRAVCDLPDAAGAGGLLLGADGRPQTGFMVRRFPTPGSLALEALLLNRICPDNRINRRYRYQDLDISAICQVEQPAGAFWMIRRDVWEKLGGLDEGFTPLWFEDVDFCKRAVDARYRWYFTPEAAARHSGGHSIPTLTLEMRRFYWYRSLLRYSFKHFATGAARTVCLAVVAGAIVRMLIEPVLDRSLRPVRAYGRVLWFASRCLLRPALGTG
jgi:GT2 family glycosyltransferase